MVASKLRERLTSPSSTDLTGGAFCARGQSGHAQYATQAGVRFSVLLVLFPVHNFELNNDTSPTATLNANIKATSSFEPHFVWIDTGVGQLV